MSDKRPNTVVILIIFLWEGLVLLWEGSIRGMTLLLTGKIKPLSASRTLRIWHWIAIDGPKKFWQFPRAIAIGRSISTLIQVIFYPKK